jgi:type I restriction enzyme M protein
MDAAEYKRVVLGLIFLKDISDAFAAKHAELVAQHAQGAEPEDPDEYRAANIFWVPEEARWSHRDASAPRSARLLRPSGRGARTVGAEPAGGSIEHRP